MPRSHVDTQLHITGIPSNARYRLLNFRLDSTKNQSINRAITAAAKTINRGNSHAFMRDSNLLVLCYTPPSNETAASLNKVMRNIADTMHKPYGIAAGISQVFTDIKDIDFAYKQTVEALNRRHSLMKMYPEGYFDDAAFPGFPFDHVLQFIVFDEHRDQELVRYSLAHSNLHTLAKEDAEAGTDTVSLLWSYIRDGRNASRTSEKMHVHRNTVIYHVKKFEGRFDLSLNSTMVRHRLLFDFIEYFRVQS